MAESQVVANKALKKLEDQLTCAICLDAFKDPKLLQCFHVYCKDCLQRLVVQNQQGQLSVCCPTCRQSTLLPPTATDLSSLQSAFHIHHLFEIQDALEKAKEPHKVKCEKCKTPQQATSYCRDCGKFICAICTTVHSQWDAFTQHEVVPLDQLESKVKRLDTLKNVTFFCSLHEGKELDLYCQSCEELICLHCTVKKHKDHQYDLVGDVFERHITEITATLEPVEEQLDVVNKAMEQLDKQSQELIDQGAANESGIEQQINELIDALKAKKVEMISQNKQLIQTKLKNLAAQKDELETVQAQLVSCLSFVRNSIKTGSQGEVMTMKKAVTKQIKEMTDNLHPDMLPPCEAVNVKFKIAKPDQLQQFGKVFLQQTSPEKCYATGRGLETAEPGERATAVLYIVDHKGNPSTSPVESLTCELVIEETGEKTDCSVKKTKFNQYVISYQPISRGRHKLQIKVEGEHIKGSPFSVTVKLPLQKLGTPIKTICGVKEPWGVAINQGGEIVVCEGEGHCVSIFSFTGEKVRCFGSQGSRNGQFNKPRCVAVDGDGNILVGDKYNHRIQKFTSDGKFIIAIGKKGNKPLEFNQPTGIAIHPLDDKVYVADNLNNRIQILNPDLTFYDTFGRHGSRNGLFISPWDLAFDSTGDLYIVDCGNNRIQVFTMNGKYLRQFGKKSLVSGELNNPSSISIDCDNVVYVTELMNSCVSAFTHDGKFMTSFGKKGSGTGQFKQPRRVAVDKNGVIYVSDTDNNRVQLF